jgi:hypothetical protein
MSPTAGKLDKMAKSKQRQQPSMHEHALKMIEQKGVCAVSMV